MIEGGDIRPYREPAAGGAGGNDCVNYQHAKGDELVNKYANTTSVATPTGNQFPFELFSQTPVSGCYDSPDANPAGMPDAWVGTQQYQFSMVAGTSIAAPQAFTHTDGQQINFSVCYKRGFKNAACVLQWNGKPDIFDTDYWDAVDNFEACNDSNGNAPGTAPVVAPPLPTVDGWTPTFKTWRSAKTFPHTLKKYRTRTASLEFNVSGTDTTTGMPATIDAIKSQTITVDSNSGDRNLTSCSGYSGDAYMAAQLEVMQVYADWTILNIIANFFGFTVSGSQDNPTYLSYSSDGVTGTAVIANPAYGGFDDLSGLTRESWACNVASNSFERKIYSGTTVANWAVKDQWDLTISGEGFTLIYTQYGRGAEGSDDIIIDGDEIINATLVQTAIVSYSDEWDDTNVYADMFTLMGYWMLNNDQLYPWRTDGFMQVAPLMSRLQVEDNVAPAGWLDCQENDLSSPINDMDGNVPFSVDWVPTYDQTGWLDSNVWTWKFPDGMDASNSAATDRIQMKDGSIQGAPNPAGYVDYFRFDFIDWSACCSDDGEGHPLIATFQHGQGMSLLNYISATGAQLPKNCTQWTNNVDVIDKPAGASLIYGNTVNPPSPSSGGTVCPYVGIAGRAGALWAYKYAEIAERTRSQNFARPAGKDKFLYDETQVYCYDGDTITDSDGNPVTDALAGTWGGKSVDGFFTGCSAVAGTLTTGTKVLDVPSDWASRSGDDDVAFGKLRWADKPALLGRVWIKAVADVSLVEPFAMGWVPTYQFAAGAQTQFGMTTATHQESIDAYDGAMNALSSAVTATRIADDKFTLAAALDASAYWVMIHGAQAYYFNDDFPKGDFLTLQFLLDKRTNIEHDRLASFTDCSGSAVSFPTSNNGFSTFSQDAGALPFIPCCPSVICFSPNGETWENGITKAFPTAFNFDEKRGGQWQGYVQTTMTDLFWQAPHRPCGIDSGIAWVMDDGSCNENDDTHEYYPHAPVVEARKNLPSTYGAAQNETPAALPSGIVIGWLSPVDHTGDNVAPLPPPLGFDESLLPLSILTPWELRNRLCTGAGEDSSCTFKNDYQEIVVNCQNA